MCLCLCLSLCRMPLSLVPSPISLLVSDIEVAVWNGKGLPADNFSVEIGCIFCSTTRWPLLIDPQLQVGWEGGHRACLPASHTHTPPPPPPKPPPPPTSHATHARPALVCGLIYCCPDFTPRHPVHELPCALQGIHWVRQREGPSLAVGRLGQPDLVARLIQAITLGTTFLIETKQLQP